MELPAIVDTVREREIDDFFDAIGEALHFVKKAAWLEPPERELELADLAVLGAKVAAGLIEPDPTDGSPFTTAVKVAKAVVSRIGERDPDAMEDRADHKVRRADRLALRGKHADAAELRDEAAELRASAKVVRAKIEQRTAREREARRGNG